MRRKAELQQQEGVLAKSKASHAALVAASEEKLRARSSELDEREEATKKGRGSEECPDQTCGYCQQPGHHITRCQDRPQNAPCEPPRQVQTAGHQSKHVPVRQQAEHRQQQQEPVEQQQKASQPAMHVPGWQQAELKLQGQDHRQHAMHVPGWQQAKDRHEQQADGWDAGAPDPPFQSPVQLGPAPCTPRNTRPSAPNSVSANPARKYNPPNKPQNTTLPSTLKSQPVNPSANPGIVALQQCILSCAYCQHLLVPKPPAASW